MREIPVRVSPHAADMNIFNVLRVNIYYIDLFFIFIIICIKANVNGCDVRTFQTTIFSYIIHQTNTHAFTNTLV